MAKVSLGKIAHPIWMFFLSLLFFGLTTNEVNAQSEGWAGGEITLEYAGGNCNNPVQGSGPRYNIYLEFYRDDFGITAPPFPDDKEILIYNDSVGIGFQNAFTHALQLVPNSERSVEQYCLNGNPVATEGAIYKSVAPVELYLNPSVPPTEHAPWWFFYVGEFDGDYRSPEDRNIVLGQKFFIRSRFWLNRHCGDVSGNQIDPVTQQLVPVTRNNGAPLISPTEYVFEDPVVSLCVGKEYEYDLKPIPGSSIERLEYAFAPILRDQGISAIYLTSEGYSVANPFPTTKGIDATRLEDDAILSFTPEKPFAGPVPMFVRNYMTAWYVDPADQQQLVVQRQQLVLETQREYRFIFDTDCNSRLPEFKGGLYYPPGPGLDPIFTSDNYDPITNTSTYKCDTDTFYFELDEPVLKSSLGEIGSDQGFRFASVGVGTDPANPFLDDIPVSYVRAVTTVNINETDLIEVVLGRGVGPGDYYLYMKKGDDLNTLVNRCQSVIPEYDTLANITVNNFFVYDHPYDLYSYCFPTAKPPTAVIADDEAQYTGWKYFGGKFPNIPPTNDPADDTIFVDTLWNGPMSYVLDKPDDPDWVNSKINIAAGWWAVGVGKDYSTFDQQTGQIIEQRICYDEDFFYVDTISVEPFEIPDFDLCPREDLPVIDLTAYKNDIISSSFNWGKWNYDDSILFISQTSPEDLSTIPSTFVPDSIGRDYETVSTVPFIFDTEGAAGNVGDTNFFRAMFRMKGKYNPNKACPVQIEFKVLKQLVEVQLNYPADSVICDGEQYVLRNTMTEEYFIPEQYSFQWYLNQVALPNDTTDTCLITTTGMYTLEVTKDTDSSSCVEYDSVFVRVSPYLDATDPVCTEITFNNGVIEQLFSWGTVPNANDYEARTVEFPEFTEDGRARYGPWEKANGEFGINHRTFGPQVALQVRAVNLGVSEDKPCRYGDTTIAQACEAIVKPTNVFTPNGDGINDFLKFDLVELFPNSTLKIFNRWGKMIYEDNNYFNDWDGESFKEGTYFYVLDINDPNQELLKGTFTIIRD